MWERWQKGESLEKIAQLFDRHHPSIERILAQTGGIRPAQRRRSRLALSLAEREEISRAVVAGQSIRSIGKVLGRAPSTISREVKRNGGRVCYRASNAEQATWDRARRDSQEDPKRDSEWRHDGGAHLDRCQRGEGSFRLQVMRARGPLSGRNDRARIATNSAYSVLANLCGGRVRAVGQSAAELSHERTMKIVIGSWILLAALAGPAQAQVPPPTGTSALVLHITILSALCANLVVLFGDFSFIDVEEIAVPWKIAFILAPVVIVGGQIGSMINSKLSDSMLVRSLMTAYTLVGLFVLFNVLRG